MTDVLHWISELLVHIQDHAPWIVYLAVMTVVTQVVERALVQRGASEPIYLVYPRRLQSLLPIILAWPTAYLYGGYPEPWIVSRIGACGYFASAGCVSLFAYDIAKELIRRKLGVTVHLPGTTVYPAPPVVEVREPTLVVPPPHVPKDE